VVITYITIKKEFTYR